jgi:hypothetical protein
MTQRVDMLNAQAGAPADSEPRMLLKTIRATRPNLACACSLHPEGRLT